MSPSAVYNARLTKESQERGEKGRESEVTEDQMIPGSEDKIRALYMVQRFAFQFSRLLQVAGVRGGLACAGQ